MRIKTSQHLENPIKYSHILTKERIKCSCGHCVNIPPNLDKIICTWCGNYVFRDKKTEFEYRMKERMNNGKSIS